MKSMKLAWQMHFTHLLKMLLELKLLKKADIVIKNFDEFLYMHDFPRAISYPRNRIKILLLENLHPNEY